MAVINGKLIATSDVNMVVAREGTVKVLYLGDIESKPDIRDMITPTVLVPSYQSLSALVEGRVRDYEKLYLRSLQTPQAVETFASLLGLLHFGHEVIMLFPVENADLNYSEMLLTHIQRVYGITAQSKNTYYAYDTNFDPVNARLLYMYNIIKPENYVMMTRVFNDMDINKLKIDIAPVWNIPVNVPNEEFVRILGEKKDQIIKFGRLSEPMMVKVGGNNADLR